ncbi:MAG: AAA family ATPase [Dehalococcoidia bacterium]|nr:AAA family ATPase [Dehalococcoidia bacterium]
MGITIAAILWLYDKRMRWCELARVPYTFDCMIERPQSPSLKADAEDILTSLARPELPQTEIRLVMMAGLPGSGKSTVARRLAPEIDAVIIESDAARATLAATPSHNWAENRRVWGAVYEAARRLLNDGISVIIDGTNLTEADRRHAYELADSHKARLVLIGVTANEAVISARLAQREKEEQSRGGAKDWYDLYRRMRSHQEPIQREHLSIDTSNAAESEVAFRRVVAASRPAETAMAAAPRGGRRP